jgi:predicted nucleic acid-binding protein
MTTTAIDQSLIGTNVLVYALYEDARYHHPARAFLERSDS